MKGKTPKKRTSRKNVLFFPPTTAPLVHEWEKIANQIAFLEFLRNQRKLSKDETQKLLSLRIREKKLRKENDKD